MKVELNDYWNCCHLSDHFQHFIDVKYSCVKIVGDKTSLWGLNASLGKSIKKFDVFSIKEEHAMLSQAVC